MDKFGNEVNTNNARNANNTKQLTLAKFVPLKVIWIANRSIVTVKRYRKETEEG